MRHDLVLAERTLATLVEVIAYQTGQNPEDITDPVATLDEIFHHKAATGLINRRGRHWFSDEDIARLQGVAYGRSFDAMQRPQHPIIHQVLAALHSCHTGEDFTHLMAEVMLQAYEQLSNLQGRLLDISALMPGDQIFITKYRA